MKAVIIGGGIAGLAAGVLLRKNNFDIEVYDKSSEVDHKGFAFLMGADGINILKSMFPNEVFNLKRQAVHLFSLKRPNGEEDIKIGLKGWSSIKRVDLVNFLMNGFGEKNLRFNHAFSHFMYENDKVVAAVFDNGHLAYGDIFIGADGSQSKVRQSIFGDTTFSATEVKEVVGVSQIQVKVNPNEVVFQKFQSKQHGLAFGYIPLSCQEVVWFMQYDINFEQKYKEAFQAGVKDFCQTLLLDFPEEVQRILEANDFSKSYFWWTRDFDLLPSFHKKNVVLIGDSAHLALPFTSAGTSNAIIDALALQESLMLFNDCEQAFANFYKTRSMAVKSHVEQGRELKKLFLHPEKFSERGFILPLVSDDGGNGHVIKKPLKIRYFTDPVCSTCWIIQPILRKLKLEYGHVIDIEYLMGGLLPSWTNYDRGVIKNPGDAAKFWEDVSQTHRTPIVGDVWLEDPLESSFPPSIAFKAAQLQNLNKATLFLRRLKEMVFIEKQNITKWAYIEKAALKSGLDSALLLKDMRGKGKELFMKDLKMSEDMDVNIFPTLYFSNQSGHQKCLKGYHSYEEFESVIIELLPGIEKMHQTLSAEKLFEMFDNMTEQEFAFLRNIELEAALKELHRLFHEEKIEKYINKNGIVWMNKSEE